MRGTQKAGPGPVTSRSLAKALRGNAPRGLAPTHVEPGNAAAEHRMPAWRPLAFTVEAMVGINSLHVADSKAALSAPPNSKNDPKRARAGTADASCFPPCFFSVICFCRN